MKGLLTNFNNDQVRKIISDRGAELPKFKVGDTISVKYKIADGATIRTQAFNGVVIAKTKNDSNYSATFTVRKMSSGVGVERKFLLYSPLVSEVEILKRGIVRRSKLYYIRNLTGKASRIKEKLDFMVKVGAASGTEKVVNETLAS